MVSVVCPTQQGKRSIETAFGYWKSKLFNMEDIRLIRPFRLHLLA